jgi:hypothetical protein
VISNLEAHDPEKEVLSHVVQHILSLLATVFITLSVESVSFSSSQNPLAPHLGSVNSYGTYNFHEHSYLFSDLNPQIYREERRLKRQTQGQYTMVPLPWTGFSGCFCLLGTKKSGYLAKRTSYQQSHLSTGRMKQQLPLRPLVGSAVGKSGKTSYSCLSPT